MMNKAVGERRLFRGCGATSLGRSPRKSRKQESGSDDEN